MDRSRRIPVLISVAAFSLIAALLVALSNLPPGRSTSAPSTVVSNSADAAPLESAGSPDDSVAAPDSEPASSTRVDHPLPRAAADSETHEFPRPVPLRSDRGRIYPISDIAPRASND
jgi:hypothetical protein